MPCTPTSSVAASLETYTTRLKQLEEITNNFKGVDKSFAIQAGREVRVMVVPEQINDADMVLLARDISKQIEAELEYPGQIKINVIRESRVGAALAVYSLCTGLRGRARYTSLTRVLCSLKNRQGL